MAMNSAGLLFLSVVLAGFGQLCLKTGVLSFVAFSWSRPTDLLKMLISPLVILGFLLYGGSSISWLVALTRTRLSVAYPFTALTFVLVMLLSRFVLKEPIPFTRAMGIAVICLGFLLASR